MRCIHGFEENECPTCRLDKISIPPISATLNKKNSNKLKAENPYFKKHLRLKNDFENNLMNINKFSQPLFTNLVPRPNRLNFKSGFQNELLLKKLDEYSLDQIDKFNILKKVDLKKPELDLESED